MYKNFTMFLEGWDATQTLAVKQHFNNIYSFIQNMPEVSLQYYSRPGISHSIRLCKNPTKERPFFALLDIIDDNPDERWLSICMYADLAEDPKAMGDLIPGGLNGHDAVCFNIDQEDFTDVEYVITVLDKASQLI